MDDLPTPTPRELELLKVLWEHGPKSVGDVHRLLRSADGKQPHVNTVQTLLRLMETKGLVKHRAEGRTFIYTPQFRREESTSRVSRPGFRRVRFAIGFKPHESRANPARGVGADSPTRQPDAEEVGPARPDMFCIRPAEPDLRNAEEGVVRPPRTRLSDVRFLAIRC